MPSEGYGGVASDGVTLWVGEVAIAKWKPDGTLLIVYTMPQWVASKVDKLRQVAEINGISVQTVVSINQEN